MKGAFFIVGPTASGKSSLAAEVAHRLGAEVVSADAFQIYSGLDLLTAKPEAKLLRLARHHLLGAVPLTEEMNAERFRRAAMETIQAIRARGKRALVVGGSGLYVKALTHGLSSSPPADLATRARLNQLSERELLVRLRQLDPEGAARVDARNKRRLTRAIEICLLTGKSASAQRAEWTRAPEKVEGVFVFRERNELYERIERRVEEMFRRGVVNEVRETAVVGATAARTLGLSHLRELIGGQRSEADCMAAIQQATRRYAKRQLTWFQRQSTFEPLNLSLHGSSEAIELITRKARLSFAQQDD